MARQLQRFAIAVMVGAVGLALPPGERAQAQSIDYSAMEQLFGEPVTVSVTGKPQRVTDAPANIDIITQDDIRRSGATDIPGVLAFVTGLDVRRGGMATTDVGLRGYNQANNPRLMVLVDGRQVYMDDYGRILWAAIPVQLDEIRQIEVIRGPSSALYGFNAISGVISIITYDPLHEKINTVTLRGGTQNYAGGSAVATGRIGESVGVRLSLGGFESSDYPPGPLPASDAASRLRPFTGVLNADTRVQISSGVEGFFSASFGNMRIPGISPAGAFDTEQLHANSVRVGLDAETRVGLLSLSAYRNDAQDDVYSVSTFFGPSTFSERQIVTVVQASDLIKLGSDHTLRAALEFRQNSASSALLNGNLTNQILAGSLMWDWQIIPELSLTNAVRIDHVETDYDGTPVPGSPFTKAQYDSTTLTQPSFNSGAVWKVTEKDTLRLTGARGIQLPTLMDQALQIPAGQVSPVAFYGQPSLHASPIWSVELDYDRSVPALASSLRTALFWQRIDDIIAWPFGGTMTVDQSGIPTFMAGNVGYSTAAGLEIGIKGHAESGWRWNASYALATTTDHTSLNRYGAVTSIVEYAHSAPRHVVIAGIGYSLGGWEADLQTRWQSSYLDFRDTSASLGLQPVTVENYIVASGRIGYRVTEHLTVALTLQQFNQARIAQTAGPLVERSVILSTTARF